jgi:hypothetical protein
MVRRLRKFLPPVAVALTLVGCGVQPGVVGLSGRPIQASGIVKNKVDQSRTVMQLRFRDRPQLEALAAAGVDLFENVDLQAGTVDASVTSQTLPILKRLNVTYRVKQSAEQLGAAELPAGYKTVEQALAEVNAVANANPGFMRLVRYGTSLEGNPLVALRITAHPEQRLPAVRIMSGTHAREMPTVELNLRLVKLLADGYNKDATITRLINERDIYLIAMVNPDGRKRVEGGASMWRKNTRPLGGGVFGVDLNRNGDDHFEQGNNNPSSDSYRGTAPFSEPESDAIRKLCDEVRFKLSMDIHCYAGMILWPPGYSGEYTPDDGAFRAIGDRIAKPLGYKAGTIARTIYRTFGDLATWEYNKYRTLAFAAELNSGSFAPRYGQVEKDWEAWRDHLLYLIDVAGNPKAEHRQDGKMIGFTRF